MIRRSPADDAITLTRAATELQELAAHAPEGSGYRTRMEGLVAYLRAMADDTIATHQRARATEVLDRVEDALTGRKS